MAENMKVLLVSLAEPLKLVSTCTTVSTSHNASLTKQGVGQLLHNLVLGEAVKFALSFQDLVNGFDHGIVASEVELQVTICVTEHHVGAVVLSF